ncbi:membrane protein insertase YidC [Solilutibacter silvestris]|uniref:Membrane protein insertase YidC n=1 Tax=Solilutibacter silvestris TaxID=1645665 RepID=A0A2K1Q138_9GAMM|nr:membrane protein insertase YidC [Lysobacter silvestris]PNS08755.1 membrane protein insertase YidC/Oxa1 [Lysobacter silvestris]
MNQTRLTLLFAWLMVAVLLWMEWGKEHAAPQTPAAVVPVAQTVPQVVPGATPATVPTASVPGQAAAPATTSASAAPAAVQVETDVLRVQLDGGSFRQVDLLQYPKTLGGNDPVRLFSADNADYYQAQTGWSGQGGSAAPNHAGFVADGGATQFKLAPGANTLDVPFTWVANGVTIHRVVRFTRGSYAVDVRDSVSNAGTTPWQGYVYRQLVRVPPTLQTGMMHPESYSFVGATWSDGKHYARRPFKDYMDGGAVDQTIQGGWLAMPQHHFISVWIPQADQSSKVSLSQNGPADSIAAMGPGFTVQPGQAATTTARLWVGPKDVKALDALGVPGLDRAIDYSRFDMFAYLGTGLFWLLSKIHGLIGNWGWSIIGLVFLLKLALFPLSNAQYKSTAKMRRMQPRMKALQERYGDDKQKLQMAMMELYKTEKINPIGGCLPIIPQTIIFMTLYWVLSESVELRHAPWMGWIHDLTARDPYFVLPILNAAIMFFTQHLTPPAPGMDPTQQKMMKAMPVIFGVILAFLPAGLVLYQVANGALGLLQQTYMLRKYADKASPGTHETKKK